MGRSEFAQKRDFEKLRGFFPELLLALCIDKAAGELTEEIGGPFSVEVGDAGDADD